MTPTQTTAPRTRETDNSPPQELASVRAAAEQQIGPTVEQIKTVSTTHVGLQVVIEELSRPDPPDGHRRSLPRPRFSLD